MDRNQFLKLSGGIIGGLGIPGVFGDFIHAEETESDENVTLDDSYLVKGLTAMVRANGWFAAHWGAGVIAGYYLCKDNHLGNETTNGIKHQLDTVINLHTEQFAALPQESANQRLIEVVPQSLRPAMAGGLRAHGHAVIFASLAIKALRDVPQMAQPTVIRGLCALSRQIAKLSPQEWHGPEAEYSDTQAMIDATFDSLARFEVLLGHPSIVRPNFTHMTTHTEALMNLEMMGYADLARAGHIGHRAHIHAPVPEIKSSSVVSTTDSTLEAVMSQEYWNDKQNQDRWRKKWQLKENPNGDWIASGHLFKVLYGYHRLIGRVHDKDKVSLCSKILLERYINPDVRGG